MNLPPIIDALVHERDEQKCVACGSAENLEAHHIEAVKDGGLPTLENLETLCEECHKSL
jgi:5-methylcytosine-specific restriction endonuclease McrA